MKNRSIARLAVISGIFAWLAFRVISHAWVSDDAYITFRVVDNFIHGFGLTWNIDERVQVYTHPLWMLLHIPFYALFGNIYLTTIFLSLVCFALAVFVAMRGRDRYESALFIALPLSLSQPVIDYATSGLENPLSMLLIAVFAQLLSRKQPRWRDLGIISALLILNRMDMALILFPSWLWLLWHYRASMKIKPLLPGALMLAAWYAFSLFYYGFIFPNTKYAKLNTGIAETELFTQGLYYLLELFVRDAFSFLLIAGLVIGAIYGLVRRRISASLMLALGGALYCIYVIAVGGDFMSGRFWSIPVFLAICLLPAVLPPAFPANLRQAALWAGVIIAVATISFCLRESLWSQNCAARETETGMDSGAAFICSLHGIIDERSYYLANTGLFTSFPIRREPSGAWINKAEEWRDSSGSVPQTGSVIGLIGFYAGPNVIFIDKFALAEPLLARLPMRAADGWRIGHFERAIPMGFMEARQKGDLSRMDKKLGEYYQKLRQVTSGELLSTGRLEAIIGFQLGEYESLRRAYIARHCSEFYGACPGQ